ncbi:TadG family pilus assembly protein [Variovorax sp. VaC1]|uniref:TadG family pilus assembly protein n=1 Tax=Variovorax sp. VaC1 TaxID=3373132 RepID=UPI00374942CD
MIQTHGPALRPSGARRTRARRSKLRGSVVLNAVIALSLVLIVLIGTELGYLFYMKRELQKAADLSALAGTQILQPTNCAAAQAAASASAAQNLPFMASQYVLTATCGVWDPTVAALKPTYFSSTGSGKINALYVRIVGTPSLIFPSLPGNSARTVVVEAYAAKDAAVAAFSVGSKLIDINSNAPLISVLKLVGADISGTCVGCYTGLAGVKITPGGLLSQLGIPITTDLTVAGLNALLAAKKVTLGQLLDAIATVAGQSGLLAVNANLINSLVSAGINVDTLLVQLGTDATSGVRGLFAQITAPTSGSALDVKLDALNVLTTAVGIGTNNHAVELATGINLLGLSLSVQSRVIEPPSIGIGGVGTTAYNSQVRVYIVLMTKPGELLGDLLGALGTQINLPISIDVVNALGTLNALNCDTTPPQATIHVEAPILSACIGRIDPLALWSKTDVCSTDLTGMTLVQLLGINLLQGKAYIPALQNPSDVTLKVGETQTTGANSLPIGDTVSTLLNQLLTLLLGGNGTGGATPADRASNATIAASMADYYLSKTNQVSTLRSMMEANNLTWSRPVLLGLLSTTMPQEWEAEVNTAKLLGGCGGSLSGTCARNFLIQSLQSPNQDGLVTGLLKGLISLVTGLLGLNPNAGGTPLLSALLGPLIQLLQPILNTVGGLISNLLSNTLGLELGRTDVFLQSVSCQNAKLVY